MRLKYLLSLVTLEATTLLLTFLALEVFNYEGVVEANELYYFFANIGIRYLFYAIGLGITATCGAFIELMLKSVHTNGIIRSTSLIRLSFALSLYSSLATLLSVNSIHDILMIVWLVFPTSEVLHCIRLLERVLSKNSVALIIFLVVITYATTFKALKGRIQSQRF